MSASQKLSADTLNSITNCEIISRAKVFKLQMTYEINDDGMNACCGQNCSEVSCDYHTVWTKLQMNT